MKQSKACLDLDALVHLFIRFIHLSIQDRIHLGPLLLVGRGVAPGVLSPSHPESNPQKETHKKVLNHEMAS